MGRVIAGGLAAGLIINIGETILNVPLAGEAMEQALQARNLPPVGGGAIGYFVVMCFLLVPMAWLRSRQTPAGSRTEDGRHCRCARMVHDARVERGSQVAMGIMPLHLTLLGLVWGLGE